MVRAKQKPRELYGHTGVAVVFRRGFYCLESEGCSCLPKVTCYKQV